MPGVLKNDDSNTAGIQRILLKGSILALWHLWVRANTTCFTGLQGVSVQLVSATALVP